jgi:hypothetical protein
MQPPYNSDQIQRLLLLFQFVLMLLTSSVASPQKGPRIELFAPPIPINHSPLHVPVPVYGAPPVPSEGSLISPGSIPINQNTVPSPKISAPHVQTPAPIPDNTLPIRSSDEIVHIPESSISIPEGKNEIVLPPGTSISLRDSLGQFSHG